MQLIDTHAHLTFDELKQDVDNVVKRSIEAGITGWVTVGTEPGGLAPAVEVAQRYENMSAAVGIHPHYAKDITKKDLEEVNSLCQKDIVRAVGEMGLDFHYNFSAQDAQRQLFEKQLNIAAETGKPAIIHSRNAFDETLEILRPYVDRVKKMVVHCWGGSVEQTRTILDLGLYLSITGIVTFKKSDQLRESVKIIPTDRLMLETDCPYISPEPVRNQRPCEPWMLVHTAEKVAQVKEMPVGELADQTTRTAKSFFNIDLA